LLAPQQGEGHRLAGAAVLEQHRAAARAQHQAGQEAAITAEGRILATFSPKAEGPPGAGLAPDAPGQGAGLHQEQQAQEQGA
jgi:hypothetical protein